MSLSVQDELPDFGKSTGKRRQRHIPNVTPTKKRKVIVELETPRRHGKFFIRLPASRRSCHQESQSPDDLKEPHSLMDITV
jgi:hypothetical protein